jgi:hypothetical protein
VSSELDDERESYFALSEALRTLVSESRADRSTP